jgi:hypothetical protein
MSINNARLTVMLSAACAGEDKTRGEKVPSQQQQQAQSTPAKSHFSHSKLADAIKVGESAILLVIQRVILREYLQRASPATKRDEY